ncbi:MAG TPA: FCSD flavin-binding domain-containing protein [Burkholderiales bacterium]|nr:FCSD flavin-binding domain-containing protein [Burkholderiales bacterium]
MKRRDFLRLGAGLSVAGCATRSSGARPRVVVVGGGYGGATAAKHVALEDPGIEVTLVEPAEAFVSCPLSNLVVGGSRTMADITRSYAGLAPHGVRLVRDRAVSIEADKRTLALAHGTALPYDRLIVSPGVDFMLEEVEGYAAAAGRVLHAWKAGPQTAALRRQLEAMPDGGVYLLSIPLMPYRCPPAPYERACQVASYFRRAKPRSKVLVLDANQEITSEAAHFQSAWNELYKDLVDYRPNSAVTGIEPGAVRTDFEKVKADVLNVVPPQRAGDIAAAAGLITHNKRWCDVDWRTMQSTAVPGVHVLGDSTLPASAMPKSGQMAHAQAQVCAAAVVALIRDRAPDPQPEMTSLCYSFLSEDEAVRLSSVHRYDVAQRTMVPLKGSASLSPARSRDEAAAAWRWARDIWSDMLD